MRRTYLKEEREKKRSDRYAAVLGKPVADALLSFCRQDGEFAQAVAQIKNFTGCLAAVAKGAGGCLSDLDAMRGAVKV